MTKVDALDSLFAARDQVTRLIIHTVPPAGGTDAELLALVQKREQLSVAIARLIQADIQETSAQLDDAARQIDACTAKLQDLAAKVESVTTAINVVSQVLGVVATVVSLAASAAA